MLKHTQNNTSAASSPSVAKGEPPDLLLKYSKSKILREEALEDSCADCAKQNGVDRTSDRADAEIVENTTNSSVRYNGKPQESSFVNWADKPAASPRSGMGAREFWVANWQKYPAIMKAPIFEDALWNEILGLAEAYADQKVRQLDDAWQANGNDSNSQASSVLSSPAQGTMTAREWIKQHIPLQFDDVLAGGTTKLTQEQLEQLLEAFRDDSAAELCRGLERRVAQLEYERQQSEQAHADAMSAYGSPSYLKQAERIEQLRQERDVWKTSSLNWEEEAHENAEEAKSEREARERAEGALYWYTDYGLHDHFVLRCRLCEGRKSGE